MQPEDLQQPGVCRPPGSVCQPGLRGSLPADPDVHHPHELRQRLGSRVQVRSGARVMGETQTAELGQPSPQRPETKDEEELGTVRPVLRPHVPFPPHHNPGRGRWHHPRHTDEGTKA